MTQEKNVVAQSKRSPSIVSRFAYRQLLMPVVAIWFAGFVIAMYAPTTVLTDYWLAHFIASFMSFVATPIGIEASKSTFPEVSALYYSIVWWSFPLWFLVCWKWAKSHVGKSSTGILLKARLSMADRILILLLLPVWLFLAYAGLQLAHGGDVRTAAIGSSRWQLALLGMGVPFGVAVVTTLTLFSIQRLFGIDSLESCDDN